MPIRRLQPPRQRSKILWFGDDTLLQKTPSVWKNQGFLTELGTSQQVAHNVIGDVAAAVFCQVEGPPDEIVSTLEACVNRLIDHGCLVFFLTRSSGDQHVRSVLEALKVPYVARTTPPTVFDGASEGKSDTDLPLPHVRIFAAEYTMGEALAAEVSQYSPRFPPASSIESAFRVTGPAEALCNKEKLMLRRSFHDCSEVHLTKLKGGRSDAVTYLARATPTSRGQEVYLKPRIMPFFVKLGPRRDMIEEWRNYEAFVRHQIPFHLAPRLDWGRCEMGAKLGVLVGDFVDQSESLSACAVASRASTVIGTLFDQTMREWRARCESVEGSLWSALQQKRGIWRMNASRRLLAKDLGAKKSIKELEGKVMKRPAEKWLQSPIHGDLHTNNVQVRGTDAILIDFLQTGWGPTLADPAALEADIVFRLPGTCPSFEKGTWLDKDAWVRSVDLLYEQRHLRAAPTFLDPRDPVAWMVDCVRQIRFHALSKELRPGQYAAVLAYRLIYVAGKDKSGLPDNEFRRAMAFCVAERLLDMDWT